MKTKTLAVALALTLAPTLSFAMGCNYENKDQQAMSCASGTTYDHGTHSCIPATG